jgi:hypothetical protein
MRFTTWKVLVDSYVCVIIIVNRYVRFITLVFDTYTLCFIRSIQFNHFKSASMFGLMTVSNISFAPVAVKCEGLVFFSASASGQSTSTNWRHGIRHPHFLFGPSTNSSTTAAWRCLLSVPASRGSQGPNTTIGHAFFMRRGLQHNDQLIQHRWVTHPRSTEQIPTTASMYAPFSMQFCRPQKNTTTFLLAALAS